MTYSAYFRQLRGKQKLTHDEIARRLNAHRNTIINVENGRSVKFRTLRDAVFAMGFDKESDEFKTISMLWFSQVSGLDFLNAKNQKLAQQSIEKITKDGMSEISQLVTAVLQNNLTHSQLDMLILLANSKPMLNGIAHLLAQRAPR